MYAYVIWYHTGCLFKFKHLSKTIFLLSPYRYPHSFNFDYCTSGALPLSRYRVYACTQVCKYVHLCVNATSVSLHRSSIKLDSAQCTIHIPNVWYQYDISFGNPSTRKRSRPSTQWRPFKTAYRPQLRTIALLSSTLSNNNNVCKFRMTWSLLVLPGINNKFPLNHRYRANFHSWTTLNLLASLLTWKVVRIATFTSVPIFNKMKWPLWVLQGASMECPYYLIILGTNENQIYGTNIVYSRNSLHLLKSASWKYVTCDCIPGSNVSIAPVMCRADLLNRLRNVLIKIFITKLVTKSFLIALCRGALNWHARPPRY